MVSWLAAGSNCMISILLSSRWLGFHKGLKVTACRTRFETQERAQREIFCCIETYGRTSEPFVAKKLSVRGTYSPRRIAPNKVGTPDNLPAARRRCLQLARSAIGTTQLCCLAYRASPKSMLINGSSPTTHASCPGGIDPTSPGPNSASEPSSIRTTIRPEMTWMRWPTWQLSVPTIGLTHSDQRHPGSWVTRLISTPSKSTTSILPL